MSATNQFEDDLLSYLFNHVQELVNVGDATGGLNPSTQGSARVSLHTVALDDTDTLATADECNYLGYVRQTVARSAAGWTVQNTAPTEATNAALIQFGEMTGGASDTAVHCGVCLMATGDYLQLHGDLTSDLIINTGINPQFAINALDITLD